MGAFIASMLIFGTVGIVRRYTPLPSALLAFSRGIIGGLLLLAFVKLGRKGSGEAVPGRVFAHLAVAGALMGINWILLFEAYEHTTVAVATLCYYMEPTIVTLLSPLIFRERLTAKRAACAAVSVAGMVLVSGVTGGGQVGSPRGVLLGLGAALFYSGVVIINKLAPGGDAYRRTVIQLLSAGAVMAPYVLATRSFSGGGVGASAVIMLLVLGTVHTALAYALYFGSMGALRVQTIAVLSYIDPVSALLFSALFLREPLGAAGIAGAVMIIGAAVVSETRPRGRRE